MFNAHKHLLALPVVKALSSGKSIPLQKTPGGQPAGVFFVQKQLIFDRKSTICNLL
jgi:hypothetical protein